MEETGKGRKQKDETKENVECERVKNNWEIIRKLVDWFLNKIKVSQPPNRPASD